MEEYWGPINEAHGESLYRNVKGKERNKSNE